jgi:flagellar motor switch protein FliN/FliY
MSNASPSDGMTISQDEIDRLTAGLSAEELAELGLAESAEPETPQTLSQAELDELLGGAMGGDEGPASLTLSQADLDALGFAAAEPALAAAPPPARPVAAAPSARPAAPQAPPPAPPQAEVRPVQFAPLADAAATPGRQNIDLLLDVELRLTAELGQTRLTIREILELGAGSIVELNRLAGEPVDITINNTLIAKGEVVVVDEKFGIRVLDVVSPAKRMASFM